NSSEVSGKTKISDLALHCFWTRVNHAGILILNGADFGSGSIFNIQTDPDNTIARTVNWRPRKRIAARNHDIAATPYWRATTETVIPGSKIF
ncbi:hypothetical protein ABLV19_24170, partial [Klebsiella sp. GG_Kp169]|uniref:hypothetical protein n=1 Tax=Klebsiella sp. GG_Kp169 TaxID=3153480 RepID=UPI0032B60577